ncbi:MAG TPA: hypothetical protein VEK57_08445 [Thermoanaerobaculia bacterium]|nr:hypothetical protein [Thermoanaerobaculia bacterium]
MSEVRLRRVFAVLVSLLVIAGCASQKPGDTGLAACGGRTSTDKQGPVVCVDDTGSRLSVAPDPIEAHDTLKTDRAKPVTIHWWTESGGGNLGIEMKDHGCVAGLRCETGHCWAHTIPGAAKGTATGKKNCKYDVWTTPANRLDPTILVGTCCT